MPSQILIAEKIPKEEMAKVTERMLPGHITGICIFHFRVYSNTFSK